MEKYFKKKNNKKPSISKLTVYIQNDKILQKVLLSLLIKEQICIW